MQNHFGLLVADVLPIYMIMPRYSRNYALFYQLLDSNSFTHRIMLSWEKPLVKPMAPGSIFHHINLSPTCYFRRYLFLQSLIFNLYRKNTKNIYLIISIRSHFRKWPWRDWQPVCCVGCEVLICLCRCVGLLRSLLLDWYLGSQKLREILMLLCCITLSSSRENQRSVQEVAVTEYHQIKSWPLQSHFYKKNHKIDHSPK